MKVLFSFKNKSSLQNTGNGCKDPLYTLKSEKHLEGFLQRLSKLFHKKKERNVDIDLYKSLVVCTIRLYSRVVLVHTYFHIKILQVSP